MSWSTLGAKLDAKSFRSAIAECIGSETRSIAKGRSTNRAGFSNGTPIDIIDGEAAPQLVGQPYLMTTFLRGNFSKTLYTPSTLRVVVGRKWKK